MPDNETKQREIVQRLLAAHKKSRETFENEPAVHELHPGTAIANIWPTITAAYSGLEQTLKFLIAADKRITIEQLRKCRRFRTHDLCSLFSEIPSDMRRTVQDFYRRFQSLHSYLPISTVDEFLDIVSGSEGKGYEQWRYTLIEDTDLPRNSPETMLAIWGVCVQLAEKCAWNNERVQMPEAELAQTLCHLLETHVMKVSVDRQNAGEPFQDISRETREWLWKSGYPLNAFAEILWHHDRYGTHGVEGASDWFSEVLSRLPESILTRPNVKARTSMRVYVARAQGRTRDGSSIRWDKEEERFEAVPWTLETCFREEPPPGATKLNAPDRQWWLSQLWAFAREDGFRVLENRSFDKPAERGGWVCTLRAETEDSGNCKPLLSLWEEGDQIWHKDFYLLQEAGESEMSKQLRNWINFIRRYGDENSTAISFGR